MLLFKEFPSYTLDGLLVGCIYLFLALGYSLVYRVLKIIDLSFSAAITIGTFLALALEGWWGALPKGVGGQVELSLATVALAVVAGVVLRVLLQTGMFQQLRRRRAHSLVLVIASLGAYYVLQEAMGLWKSDNLLSYSLPFDNKTLFSLGGAAFSVVDALVLGSSLISALAIGLWLRGSRFGRSVTAVAQDPIAAQLNGINVNVTANFIFAISGVLAGLGAVMYVFDYTNTQYNVGLGLAVNGLIAALLGGMGNVSGAVVGSLVFGLIESYGSAIFGSTWQDVIGYVALVVLLLALPAGLVGEKVGPVRA
ncbi:MAG: branched-chain amino acid ABC transporter permease [Mycobacteriales bacterium]